MNSANPIVLPDGLISHARVEQLNVYVYEARSSVGAAAVHAVAAEMRRLIATRGRAAGIFAAAPAQAEFFAELIKAEGIAWTRVIGFHLREYLGLDEDAPQSHRKFLLDRLVKRVPMAEFHGLRGEAANPEAVGGNYAALLKSRPADFALLDGSDIFLTASVCAADEATAVRVIELPEIYRQEQISNGTFATLDQVPRRALSLTRRTIMACPRLFVIATGAHQQPLLRAALSRAYFSNILWTHPDAHLFLDPDAASALPHSTIT